MPRWEGSVLRSNTQIKMQNAKCKNAVFLMKNIYAVFFLFAFCSLHCRFVRAANTALGGQCVTQ